MIPRLARMVHPAISVPCAITSRSGPGTASLRSPRCSNVRGPRSPLVFDIANELRSFKSCENPSRMVPGA